MSVHKEIIAAIQAKVQERGPAVLLELTSVYCMVDLILSAVAEEHPEWTPGQLYNAWLVQSIWDSIGLYGIIKDSKKGWATA